MTMITLMTDSLMMVVLHSSWRMWADQYTSIGKKVTKARANGRNPEDCTSAGWLDQCLDGPQQWTLQKLNLKSYTFTMGCSVQEKRQQVLAEGIKPFLHSLGRNRQWPKPEWCSNCRQIISPEELQSSVRNNSKMIEDVMRNLNFLWAEGHSEL